MNETGKTVTLVRQFEHNPGLDTNFEGNAQMLPNSDLFVGWGQQPYFTEFNSAGQEVFDARFTSNTSSYRAYKLPWSGQPRRRRAMVLAPNNDGTTELWSSWNGATAVASWRVLAGTSASTLVPLQTAPKQGFETSISAPTGVGDFEVQALGSNGSVLGTSPMVTAKPHIGIAGRTAFVSRHRHRRSSRGVRQRPHVSHRDHDHRRANRDRPHRPRAGSGQRAAGSSSSRSTGAGRSMLAHARGGRLLVRLTGSGRLEDADA